jgi:hypothetical protein
VPAPGEKGIETWGGDSALTGGGSSWVTGSYDPELDLVYWGIGNPAPWNPRARSGDNLFTNAIFAVRPKTGARTRCRHGKACSTAGSSTRSGPISAPTPMTGKHACRAYERGAERHPST